MKRLLNITFLLFVLLSMIGLDASAYDISVENADGKTIYYNFINNNTELAVTYRVLYFGSYSDEYSGNVVIPESVTYNEKIYSVTSIGERAFYNRSGLTSVTIPNSVTIIGSHSFYNCSGLTSVTIPNSVTNIGIEAFQGCSGLTSVIIGSGVTSIENSVFQDCSGLTSVIIGSGVKSIVNEAFAGCSELTSITIPNSVTSIGDSAFKGCSGLTSVIWNAKYCTSRPFSNISAQIKEISFGSEVEKIHASLCSGMTALTSITSEIENPFEISEFSDQTYTNATLYVPAGTKLKYKATAGWKNFTKIISGTYILTYKVDGKVYKQYELAENSAITPETAPTKTGYNFSGWSEIPKTMPANDVTITGAFTVNKYNLIYKVDGATYKTYQVAYGSTITPETAPTKTGYTFSGWSEIPKTMPANDVTITGAFTVNKYNLTYKVDGATYKTYQVAYGSTITPETAPTKTGYTFSGWKNLPSTMPAGNVTVTGTFTANKYTLTYKVDGAIYRTYQVAYGSTITPEPAPAKTGYTFSGWSEIPKTMPANDVTITGAFTVNKYNLTYKVDGATYKTYQVTYGSAITPEPAPAKTGYTFSGWKNLPSTMPAGNVTVTGTFTANKYTLTYKVDGAIYRTYQVAYGSTITPEPAPTKTWYTFSGWSEIPTTMPANNVTVTGTFTDDRYVGGIYYNYSGTEATVVSKPNMDKYTGSVTIPASVTSGGKTYGVTSIGSSAFKGCSGLTSVTIPNSVTSIGYHAFYGCTGLTSITIPNSVTNIGSSAFNGCSEMSSITIPNSVTSIGDAAFSNTAWYNNLPDGLVYAGKVAYKYKGTMPENTSITIKDGTLGISGDAFDGCHGLTSVTIPNSVTSIGNYAFSYCHRLTSITIPNSVKSIGERAFYNCYRLSSITIPNSVTSIGSSAFEYCSRLFSITIPNSVTSIGNWAFYDCTGLTSISVQEGNTKYDSRNNCNAIIETATNTLVTGCKNTIIPNNVTSIGGGAFWGCSGLTSVTIPNSVTSIGGAAFYKCSGLTSVSIPNSVTSIGGSAFYKCHRLSSITIPNSVTSIESSTFESCSELTSVTMGSGVTSIGDYAFYNCYRLSSITIPNSVTSIGMSAFLNCTGLTSIYSYIENPASVTGSGFYSLNYTNATLYVPYGTKNKYLATNGWKNFTKIVEMSAPSAINGVNAEDAKSFVGKIIKDNKIIIMKNGKKHSVSGQGM